MYLDAQSSPRMVETEASEEEHVLMMTTMGRKRRGKARAGTELHLVQASNRASGRSGGQNGWSQSG